MQSVLRSVTLQHGPAGHSIKLVHDKLVSALQGRNFGVSEGPLVFQGALGTYPLHPEDAVYLTYWESSELPKRFHGMLNRFRAIGVCNKRELDMFSSVLSTPVFMFPHGTDVGWRQRSTSPHFTFIAIGEAYGIPQRKRMQDIPYLFSQAFPVEKNVRLIIKASPRCPEIPSFDSRVTVVRNDMDRTELLDLYAQADAGVFLGAWESWGHPQIELMAMGRPIICPCWGGLKEFFNETRGIVLPHTMRRAPPGHYSDGGTVPWADEDAAIEAMRQLYYNPELVAQFGLNAARAARTFTWNNSAKILINELSRLYV